MLVLCNGMVRSGSTWSFNVILGLLRRGYPGEEIHHGYNEWPVEFMKAAPAGTRHIVMKCHGLTPLARTMVRTGAAKVVYTWRDMGDAIASRMRIFGGTFDQNFRIVGSCLPLLAFHRGHGNAVLLPYEQITGDTAGAVRRIGEYLMPDKLTARIVAEVARETSLESMNAKVQQINRTDARRLYHTQSSAFDPQTLLHRHHIGDGSAGRGERVLTSRQRERVEAFVRKHAHS